MDIPALVISLMGLAIRAGTEAFEAWRAGDADKALAILDASHAATQQLVAEMRERRKQIDTDADKALGEKFDASDVPGKMAEVAASKPKPDKP